MSDQKLLSAPFGYADGFHITLTAADGFNESETMRIVMSFGCPMKVAEKAVSCLRNSGRYDCVMSPLAWEDGFYGRLRPKLKAAGVDLHLLSGPNPDDPGLAERHDRQVEIRQFHYQYGGEVAKAQAQNLPR